MNTNVGLLSVIESSNDFYSLNIILPQQMMRQDGEKCTSDEQILLTTNGG